MRQILHNASEKGWHGALLQHADSVDGLDFYDYAASDTRSGFKFLLDRFSQGTVLDYGCGLGGIAISLARNFAHVYATDLTPERARFTQVRGNQEQLQNLTVFCSGDTQHVPLDDHSLDVIVLNGVLEWVPDFRIGKPRNVQIEFLEEMRRLLKHDGMLYIGIENRLAYAYFSGQREEHSLLPFVSLLPRWAADLYSRHARGRPYRTHTYTRRGYRSLLASAALNRTQFFGLIPDYREIDRAFRTTDRGMVREALSGKRGIKRIRNAIVQPFFPAVVGSYGILASSQPIKPYFDRLVEHIAEVHLQKTRLQTLGYSVSRAGAVHLRLRGEEKSYYVKVPLSPRATERMARGVDGIHRIQTIASTHAPQLLIPPPIAWAKYLGQAYLLEPLIAGAGLDQLTISQGLTSVLPKLVDYLTFLARITRQTGDTWANILTDKAKDYGRQLSEAYRVRGLADHPIEAKIESIVNHIERQAGHAEGFRCSLHGDFWHGNALMDRSTKRLTAVMDWDFFELESLPFLDLFNMLVKDAQYFHAQSFGEAIRALNHRLGTDSLERRAAEAYAGQLGVDNRLIPLFFIIYWIRQSLLLLKVDLPKAASAYKDAIDRPLSHFYASISSVDS